MSRPGDWNCRSCQHLNFQRRDSCQRCQEPRTGERADYGSFGGRGGGSSFGFAGPDVRPGDWYCAVGNCGTHNFASRSICFKCGACKDDVSGGGGGFDSDMPRGRGFGFGSSGSGSGNRSAWKSGDWICTRYCSLEKRIKEVALVQSKIGLDRAVELVKAHYGSRFDNSNRSMCITR
ncbi:hypothetical protein TEA_008087 [Camellia sinensis var. sinensis]|uniref:RanBP2-type domain-containing protein n=1 Tax=Camellia sinensis var. sinensis TaxID=542762 RepID=A0A4S4D4I1_CAMSN|nr:hypothetical protein TEA_008087 [Camellia sinensis var. sinensis]